MEVLSFLHSPEFQSSLATIVLGLAAALALFVTKTVVDGAKAHLSADQYAALKEFASLAVSAAEEGKYANLVTDKKASAIKVVQQYLDAAGITGFTASQIDAAIEAAVLQQFNAYKVMAASAPDVPAPGA